MDAGDWTRLKKLNGARGNMYVVVGPVSPAPPPTLTGITNPDPRVEAKTNRHVYTEFGTSKIRRPASNYTDYVASQTADYILESGGPGPIKKKLVAHKLCTCTTTDPVKHNGLCVTCQYDKIVSNTDIVSVTQLPIAVTFTPFYVGSFPVVAGRTIGIDNQTYGPNFTIVYNDNGTLRTMRVTIPRGVSNFTPPITGALRM
jgi:hypothetical protein